MNLERLRLAAARANGRYQLAAAAARAESEALKGYERDAAAALEAQSVLQAVAASVQSKAIGQIEAVVNKCLRTVFGPKIGFKIDVRRRRGRTDATLAFVKKGVSIDPQTGESGGVTEVAAFGLRLACLMLTTPHRRRLMVLDEPFKSVHGPAYRARLAGLLETLAEELQFQVVMVTGLEWLKVGKVIELGGGQ